MTSTEHLGKCVCGKTSVEEGDLENSKVILGKVYIH